MTLPLRARSAAALAVAFLAACESPAAPAPCGPIPQVTVNVGGSASVTACFNDANRDILSYTATSSNPSVATASIAGTAITVRAIAPGNAGIIIVASAPGGLQGQQSVQVTVPNRPPQPTGTLPRVTVPVGGSATVDVSQHFTEPDGEALSYAAASSDPAVGGRERRRFGGDIRDAFLIHSHIEGHNVPAAGIGAEEVVFCDPNAARIAATESSTPSGHRGVSASAREAEGKGSSR